MPVPKRRPRWPPQAAGSPPPGHALGDVLQRACLPWSLHRGRTQTAVRCAQPLCCFSEPGADYNKDARPYQEGVEGDFHPTGTGSKVRRRFCLFQLAFRE